MIKKPETTSVSKIRRKSSDLKPSFSEGVLRPVNRISCISGRCSKIFLLGVVLVVMVIEIIQADWKKPNAVLGGDGLSYYGYITAFFIHHDLTLSNYDPESPESRIHYGSFPKKSPSGQWVLPTTMGLALLIIPFFLIAHLIAQVTPFPLDGYSEPYQFMLLMTPLIYLTIGLIWFRKLLLRHFRDVPVALGIAGMILGTNVLYYLTTQPVMSHTYNVALSMIFIYLTDRWHDQPTFRYSALLGLVSGLLSLIRPTYAIIGLCFVFWNISSAKGIPDKIKWLARQWHYLSVMVITAIIVWIPQMIYWKIMSGSPFFWSYGEEARFFFGNPQIFHVLFSYRKGWLLYTPMMLFALAGIPLLWKMMRGAMIPVLIFLLFTVYLVSSWWSWWFGASFGHRAMIDTYGLLLIPFTAFIQYTTERRWPLRAGLLLIITFLLFLNGFQVWQARHNLLDTFAMTRRTYWMHFLKTQPIPEYYDLLVQPDYQTAKQGKYYTEREITNGERKKAIYNNLSSREDSILYYMDLIRKDNAFYIHVKQKAKERNIPVEEMIRLDAQWLHEKATTKRDTTGPESD
ncbi:MAG: hypothetical protein JW861_07130 [Bacteroidales bacterium]|nr:hypothetical protein [Bacteroidales bacterium]